MDAISDRAGDLGRGAESASDAIVDAAERTLPTGPRRVRLAAEFFLLYLALPLLGMVLARSLRAPVVPAILLLGAGALAVLLRDPTFDRRQLGVGRTREGGRGVASVLILVALFGVGAAAAVWALNPDRLFWLPRHRPQLWGAIMVLYPFLSVYPQELVYRTLLFHRYGPLLGSPRATVLASAAAFAFAHVLFENWLAIGLTLLGGLLFATTYERSRSTLLVSVEHALYGCVVFTIGLGQYFYLGPR